jgi:hypothetical protein
MCHKECLACPSASTDLPLRYRPRTEPKSGAFGREVVAYPAHAEIQELQLSIIFMCGREMSNSQTSLQVAGCITLKANHKEISLF